MISYEKIIGYNIGKDGVKCTVCQHYYFKDKFDYQPYIFDKRHEFSVTVINLSDFFISNIKGVDYRVYICSIDKKEAANSLNNSLLGDKGAL